MAVPCSPQTTNLCTWAGVRVQGNLFIYQARVYLVWRINKWVQDRKLIVQGEGYRTLCKECILYFVRNMVNISIETGISGTPTTVDNAECRNRPST